ncbi:hypothetical protein [Streptomyces sundarbansensis]
MSLWEVLAVLCAAALALTRWLPARVRRRASLVAAAAVIATPAVVLALGARWQMVPVLACADPDRLAAHRDTLISLLRERYGSDFVGAHLARCEDGSLLDLILWASPEAAERAAREMPGDPAAAGFFGLIGEVHEARRDTAQRPAVTGRRRRRTRPLRASVRPAPLSSPPRSTGAFRRRRDRGGAAVSTNRPSWPRGPGPSASRRHPRVTP